MYARWRVQVDAGHDAMGRPSVTFSATGESGSPASCAEDAVAAVETFLSEFDVATKRRRAAG